MPATSRRRRKRTNPIGTGPFKFVELKQNESIKLVKNPDYWKKGLPYLDGIEYTILPNRSTAILGFVAGKFDITFPTEVSIPLLKDVKSQAPNAVCVLEQTNVATNLIINRESAPFDNAKVRRAVALSLDRKSFVDILFAGNSDLGGAMLPPPNGVWGLPPEELKDRHRLRRGREEEPRRGAQADGEGGLRAEQAARAEGLDPQSRGLSRSGGDPDRPAQGHLYRRRARRGRERHLVRQGRAQGILRSVSTSPAPASTIRTRPSTRTSAAARSATTPTTATRTCRSSSTRSRTRPTPPSARSSSGRSTRSCRRTWRGRSFITRDKGTCWQPYVKNVTIMRNSSYNGHRYEDVWMDK